MDECTNLNTGAREKFTRKDYFEQLHNYSIQNRRNTRNKSRYYMKDIDCPTLWADALHDIFPPNILYHAPTIIPPKAPASQYQHYQQSSQDTPEPTTKSEASPAGDLMGLLPIEHRAANLMIYVGHEGTYTPMHREMCATYSQNIMVEASGNQDSEGAFQYPGSSFWFMTQNSDSEAIEEFWRSKIMRNIGAEAFFADPELLASSNIPIFLHQQQPGDLVIIPSACYQQVWNTGTRTMKVAWNRTTPETLAHALGGALDDARLLCRDEQYKCKEIVHMGIRQYSQQLALAGITANSVPSATQRRSLLIKYELVKLRDDYVKLFKLFTDIMLEESFAPKAVPQGTERLPYEGNVLCSFCRCDIYNRFLTCDSCVREDEQGNQETFDLCMDCYCMGRSCQDITDFHWVEQHDWDELRKEHESFRRVIIALQAFHNLDLATNSPPTLQELQHRLKYKSAAQICFDEMAKRQKHVKQIRRTESTTHALGDQIPGEEVLEYTKNGKPKGRPGDKTCHTCKVRVNHPAWMGATCSTCETHYCHGGLWRAFGTLPREVLKQSQWSCPKCRNICNCADCRKLEDQNSFIPPKTQLVINAAPFADPRSRELYVDFKRTNDWRTKMLEFYAERNGQASDGDSQLLEPSGYQAPSRIMEDVQTDFIDPTLTAFDSTDDQLQRLANLGMEHDSSQYDHPLGCSNDSSPSRPVGGQKRARASSTSHTAKRRMLEKQASSAQALLNENIDPTLSSGQLPQGPRSSLDPMPGQATGDQFDNDLPFHSSPQSPHVSQVVPSGELQPSHLSPTRLEADPHAFALAAGLNYGVPGLPADQANWNPLDDLSRLQHPSHTTVKQCADTAIMIRARLQETPQLGPGLDGMIDSPRDILIDCYQAQELRAQELGGQFLFLNAVEGRKRLVCLKVSSQAQMEVMRKLKAEKQRRDQQRKERDDKEFWKSRRKGKRDAPRGQILGDSLTPDPLPSPEKESLAHAVSITNNLPTRLHPAKPQAAAKQDSVWPVRQRKPTQKTGEGAELDSESGSSSGQDSEPDSAYEHATGSENVPSETSSTQNTAPARKKGKASALNLRKQPSAKHKRVKGDVPAWAKTVIHRPADPATGRKAVTICRLRLSNDPSGDEAIYDLDASSSKTAAAAADGGAGEDSSPRDCTPPVSAFASRTKQAVVQSRIAAAAGAGAGKSPRLSVRMPGEVREAGRRSKRASLAQELVREPEPEPEMQQQMQEAVEVVAVAVASASAAPRDEAVQDSDGDYESDDDDDLLDPVALKLKLLASV